MVDDTRIALITSASTDASPDAKGKEVWGLNLIVARLLQFLIPSFGNCTIEEIVNKHLKNKKGKDEYIDDISPYIEMQNTESSSLNEKLIRFDNLFDATDPVTAMPIQIDIEPQGTYKPTEKVGDKRKTYPLEKRSMYYCCRGISRQLQQKANHDYNSMRKFYSIWIITGGFEKGLENTIRIMKNNDKVIDAKGNEVMKMGYDPYEIIMIFLGDNPPQDSVFEYIRAVYDCDEYLLDKYLNWAHNDSDNETRKEMRNMLEYYQNKIDQAKEEAREETISLVVTNLRASGLSDDRISEISGIPIEEIQAVSKN